MRNDPIEVFLTLLVIYFIFFPYLPSGTLRRDRLCRAYNLNPNATIKKYKPIKVGIWGGRHFELIVRFTDGSTYRTKIGTTKKVSSNKWKSWATEHDFDAALRRAIAAHERAVAEMGLNG